MGCQYCDKGKKYLVVTHSNQIPGAIGTFFYRTLDIEKSERTDNRGPFQPRMSTLHNESRDETIRLSFYIIATCKPAALF